MSGCPRWGRWKTASAGATRRATVRTRAAGTRRLTPRRLGTLGAHLNLEKPLGKGRLNVVHEVLKHVEGLTLVLHQRVLLAPGAVLDRVAELVQVVEVVLPPLVEH